MKKLASFILIIALSLCAFPVQGNADTVREIRTLADGIIASELSEAGVNHVQEWIDTELADGAGNSSEWFVITLGQMGSYDFSRYCENLLRYIAEKKPTNKVALQRYALALYSAGYTENDFLKTVTDETFGKQGVMSVIYGLHLLNNGAESSEYTQQEAVNALLDRQFADGGWALNGQMGNIDITAMAVQALAPHKDNERVKTAIEKAIALMASLQDEDGFYSSYGVKNPESAAQVLCALSSVGIDFKTDQRFTKNGKTLIDGILPFLLECGGYSHTLGGAYNQTATVQVLYSLVSYDRMQSGKTPFYIFDGEPAKDVSYKEEKAASFRMGYKEIFALCAAGAFILLSIALILLKKTSKKNFLFLALVSALLAGIVFLTDIQSPEEYYTGEPVKKENPAGHVTVSIRCDVLVGKTELSHIPKDGVILAETSFPISEGDTAFTVLTDAAKSHGLHLEKNGAAGMIYITGINHLYEFDFGDLSGWNYFVNGENISLGCDQLVLKDGDRIEWLYTLELGKDLN